MLFLGGILLVLGIDFVPERYSLVPGQPSPKDFKAPQGLVYESEVLTAEARQQAGAQVEPVYRVDKTIVPALIEELKGYFQEIRSIKESPGGEEEKYRAFQAAGFELSRTSLRALLEVPPPEVNQAEVELSRLITNFFQGGVQAEALASTKEKIERSIAELPQADSQKVLMKTVLARLNLHPNLVADEAETARQREEAQRNVVPVQVTIRQGEKILGEGEIATPQKIEALEHLGLLKSKFSWFSFLGLVLLVLILYSLVLFYLYRYHPGIYQKDSYLGLLGLIVGSTLLLGRGVVAIDLGGRPELSAMVGYLVPVAAGTMLTALLLDVKLAVFIAFILGVLTGILTGNQISFAVVAMIGGLVGVYSVSHLTQRSSLAVSSLYLIVAQVAGVAAFGLVFRSPGEAVAVGIAMAVVNGIFSTVLAIGSLPFFESAFGITTNLRLMELSNANQPLLNRLLVGAPGTYHHSIMVGNLAEAAAAAIGADGVLARVGAYYHDVGKLKRPYFFIENQVAQENPHDKLAPSLSTLIITAHVKDGVELAQAEKLPPAVIDIIAQHHGTSRVSYFYCKACAKNEGEPASLTNFRYETPKPRTKEAALVMLADNVEAGVRALQKPSPKQVENLVRKIIRDKLEEGQLDECNLTFREIEVIAQTFIRIVSGLFHARVEYPETEAFLKEVEEGKVAPGVALH